MNTVFLINATDEETALNICAKLYMLAKLNWLNQSFMTVSLQCDNLCSSWTRCDENRQTKLWAPHIKVPDNLQVFPP